MYKLWSESVEFYDALAQLAYLMVTAKSSVTHHLMKPNKSKTSAILVIGSDRGLCGSYTSNLNRLIDVHIGMAKRFKRKLKIYVSGKKAVSYLNHRNIEIERELADFSAVPTPARAREIADEFIDMYDNAEIGRFSIVYNRFFSMASQQAQTLNVLPVSDLIDDLTTRSTIIWPYDLEFEDFLISPDAHEMFESLAEMVIRTALMGCFLEASLCEHLARVVAMRSASDNATEMIEDLTRQYNRARQGQITVELLDIIAGVESTR
jgi:F-type H+-transporting ATPase subunit gamma